MIVDRWYVQHAVLWHWYLPLCIDIILFNFLLFLTDAYYKVTNLLLITGQWAGPLDLYGKEDAPALHESPSYG